MITACCSLCAFVSSLITSEEIIGRVGHVTGPTLDAKIIRVKNLAIRINTNKLKLELQLPETSGNIQRRVQMFNSLSFMENKIS